MEGHAMANDSKFYMRLATDELEMLRRIAEERRMSAAHVVRDLVRREHAMTFGSGKPAERTAKR